MGVGSGMSEDATIPQEAWAQRLAQEKSLQRSQPPLTIPGYEPERLLGAGAYGEVWVFVQVNTGRRVAVKFYSHRGGLDWSFLAREVEKLAFFFSDRYVVQLIGVGWDADPPYYIMEYLPQGSLADRLSEGPIPPQEAAQLMREIAIGLVHAHNRGVLHCDLKPANVLLDHDRRPRLADFGQSRLSHEQSPALGTLFYMAPEQADLNAVPDARWDVYALGALAYCMLTGEPPRRSPQLIARLEQARSLSERLSIYRRGILAAPRPTAHRRVRGVDPLLADIIDRCLETDPAKRYPNVEAVLGALDARHLALSRRPLLIVGVVGPLLILGAVGLFAWRGFDRVLATSEQALSDAAIRSNAFAAQFVARTASNELERRFEAVENVAHSPALRELIRKYLADEELHLLAEKLSQAPESHAEQAKKTAEEPLDALRKKFAMHPRREAFQEAFARLIPPRFRPGQSPAEREDVASWFFCDHRGLSVARLPTSETIGRNYAWRSFFHGGPADLPDRTHRPPATARLRQTQLSAVFRSEAHDQWIVAVACPVYEVPPDQGEFLGVVALTVRVGRFLELEAGGGGLGRLQSTLLVDERPGSHTGMILQHPLFEKVNGLSKYPLGAYRLLPEDLPVTVEKGHSYRDPLFPLEEELNLAPKNKRWLAQAAPVSVRGESVGWWVIVAEPYDWYEGTIGWTLDRLRQGLIRYALMAAGTVVAVITIVWVLAALIFRANHRQRMHMYLPALPGERQTPVGDLASPTETMPA